MLYNVLMAPEGPTREVEAANLADVVAQLDAPFRQISIGSGAQELPLLGPLNDLPPVWGKTDLPPCPVGDGFSLARLLVKTGAVAGEAGLCRLTVDSASLLSWAESAARSCFGDCLRPPAEDPVCACTEATNPTQKVDRPDVGEELAVVNPQLPDCAWSSAQLAMLWASGLVPCGGDEELLLLAPLDWPPDRLANLDTLWEVFGAPVGIVALARDPGRHRELALAWWDRFWQCDERQFAARSFAPVAARPEPERRERCWAYRLIQEALGTILSREDLLAFGRAVPLEPGNGIALRFAGTTLGSILGTDPGRARLTVERQARGANLALVTLGSDGEERSRSWFFTRPWEGRLPWELLMDIGVVAGLSLRSWDDEAESVLPWLGNECLRVRARRSLEGLYGPVLELEWAPASGGFLAPSVTLEARRPAERPSAVGRLLVAAADWQGRQRIGLLLFGVALFVLGFCLPVAHGLGSGMTLVLLGGSACFLETRRNEPGIWMLSGLMLGSPLLTLGCLLSGPVRDVLSSPDGPWYRGIEEWLTVLILLAHVLYLGERTSSSLRLGRSIRRAVQVRGLPRG